MAPPPSVSCLHFGFRTLRLVPTPTSIGLRFVFPSEYLHRLHYDSMIGPALVYPRVPHGPWTYEAHAHGRTLSSVFSPLVLVSLLSSILVSSTYLPWYLFSLLFGFLHVPSALVLISSAFLSVNVSFCRFSLDPSFQRPQPQYEVWGNLQPHFVVSDSRIFDPPFLVFWDELCYQPPTAVWSAYTTIQGGLM